MKKEKRRGRGHIVQLLPLPLLLQQVLLLFPLLPLPPLPPPRCSRCRPCCSCISLWLYVLALVFARLCSCSLGFVCAHSVVVRARSCLLFVLVLLSFVPVLLLFVFVCACAAVHPYPLIWLSFVLVRAFRACALSLRARLGLFGFVWAHLSVSNTHLVHRS